MVEIPALLEEADDLMTVALMSPDDVDLQTRWVQLWERIADLTQRNETHAAVEEGLG